MPTSHTSNAAGRRTAERLLDAAERLVATHGSEVPLRQVTRAAGQRNNSAVAYHFGSRDGLLDAVWARRSDRVNRDRALMVDALLASGRIDDLRALVEAHVLPLAAEIGSHLPSYWARFNEAALGRMPLMLLDTFDDDLARRGTQEIPLRTLSEVFHLMRKQVADGVEPAAGLRVSLMVRFVIGSLAAWERDQEAGRVAAESLPTFAHGLVDLGHAMLVRPSEQLASSASVMPR